MRSLFLGLLLALCAPQTVEPVKELLGPELQSARAVVARMSAKLKGVERLHADFVQEQHTLLMEEPLISRGRLSLRAEPGCLLLELNEPKHVLVRSDATSHQVHYPTQKKAERYLFESNDLAKTLLSVLTVDVGAMEKAFLFTGLKVTEEQRVLELCLRDTKKRQLLSRLWITVDHKTSTLSGVSYVNADGEKTALRFTKLRYVTAESSPEERTRERDVFDRPLPKGTRLTVHAIPVAEGGE